MPTLTASALVDEFVRPLPDNVKAHFEEQREHLRTLAVKVLARDPSYHRDLAPISYTALLQQAVTDLAREVYKEARSRTG